MAFQVKDICYPTASTALDAWREMFPTEPDANGAVWYVNTASINATTGVITGSLKRSTSTATTNIAGVTLPACNSDSASAVFDKMSINDMFFPAVLVIAFILGFGQGRAK